MPDLLALLGKRFGHASFRPGQEVLIRAVLGGRDALGILPTGGGKSLCFQLPSIVHGGLTLVVSPLISLMRDQERRARAAGVTAVALHSGLDRSEVRTALDAVRRGRVQMLLVAPERFTSADFKRAISSADIRLVAIDEAHCVASWGHDFRPAYLRLAGARPAGVPLLAITATATPAVRAEIAAGLGLRDPEVVVTSFDRPNLFWGLERAGSTVEQVRRLAAIRRATSGAVIIYAGTRRRVVAVRRGLADLGVAVAGYHAGLPPPERYGTEQWFMGSDSPTMVATNAFGMGIDRGDVRAVVHVDLPLSLEALYQEAGRAGRDGRPAQAVAVLRRDGRRGRAALAKANDPGHATLVRAHEALRRAQGERGGPLTTASVTRLIGDVSPRSPVATILARLESLGSLRALTGAGQARLHIREQRPDRARYQNLRAGARRRRRAVDRYARARACRRRLLLDYFGERQDRRGHGRATRPTSTEQACCDRCR